MRGPGHVGARGIVAVPSPRTQASRPRTVRRWPRRWLAIVRWYVFRPIRLWWARWFRHSPLAGRWLPPSSPDPPMGLVERRSGGR